MEQSEPERLQFECRDMLERAGLAHGLSLSTKAKAAQEAFYRKVTHSSEMLLFFKKGTS